MVPYKLSYYLSPCCTKMHKELSASWGFGPFRGCALYPAGGSSPDTHYKLVLPAHHGPLPPTPLANPGSITVNVQLFQSYGRLSAFINFISVFQAVHCQLGLL